VHLVGFTIEIYYDARPCERQNNSNFIFYLINTNSVTNTRTSYIGRTMFSTGGNLTLEV